MTDDEKQALIDKINNYWPTRPKNSSADKKEKLPPIHDFDNLEFTDQAHIDAVRKFYEEQAKNK